MSRKLKRVFIGKRKTSIAKLVVKPGTGKVRINGIPVEFFGSETVRRKILVPLILNPEFREAHDFNIQAKGGGKLSMAEATAIAVARAVAAVSAKNRRQLTAYDRSLLAGDPRRTEPKKPNRRSARRFKQKSYR